jgi:hypothetical protein
VLELGVTRLGMADVGQVLGEPGGVVDFDQQLGQRHRRQPADDPFTALDDVDGDGLGGEALEMVLAVGVDRDRGVTQISPDRRPARSW